MSLVKFADPPMLITERVRLRPWRTEDLAPFAQMSADKEVMYYFPAVMTRAEADTYVGELQGRFRKWGFGYWAIETDELPFAGFAGLSRPRINAHFTPCVEIGWRLTRKAWGKGYATESARAALEFGFQKMGISEIVAMASVANEPSLRVAGRIGMDRDFADDFDFPNTYSDWRYARCGLFRADREKFLINTI